MKKSSSLLKGAVAFLFALAVLFNLVVSEAWALGDFSQTCGNSRIDGSILYSSCERAQGGYVDTKINLNPEIENVDGSLKWQPSNFIQTCRNTTLSGGNIMKAECKTRDQRFVSTLINLDDHIANIDGKLTYE